MNKPQDKRISRLRLGYAFTLTGFVLLTAVLALLILHFCRVISLRSYWGLFVLAAIVTLLLLVIAYFLILINSNHLRIVWRMLLIFTWWIPLWNIFLFIRVFSIVHKEYKFAELHEEIMLLHAENSDCATKYPLLLVHGIFFRDWQLVNYWGRIPRELTRCGARIYYGSQQSAAPVSESALELTHTIKKVLHETGSEKVNIIAHSKGGLDSRYAISKLGMAPFVASLTTINTPHRGCVWARQLLNKTPKKVVSWIERKYNSLFVKLGDKAPDFLGGVRDLTDTAAKRFNAEVIDSPEVLYQSVMSVMSRPSSSPFPLSACYRFVKKYDREPNDGMVPCSSALWGSFLGEIAVSKKRGVSHGDMVDLFREDIPDFDVAAYYAGLVRSLKQAGY